MTTPEQYSGEGMGPMEQQAIRQAIEAYPGQQAEALERIASGELVVPLKIDGEEHEVPLRHFRLVAAEKAGSYYAVHEGLDPDDEAEKAGRFKQLLHSASEHKGVVISLVSGAVALGALAAVRYVKTDKRK